MKHFSELTPFEIRKAQCDMTLGRIEKGGVGSGRKAGINSHDIFSENKNLLIKDLNNYSIKELDNLIFQLEEARTDIVKQGDIKKLEKLNELIGSVIDIRNRDNPEWDFIRNDKNINKSSREGSRGGKVIGHTKSGKAIYENSKHESHKKFLSEDHEDARKVHMNEKVTNRNMTERDEAAADHGREIDKNSGRYDNKKDESSKDVWNKLSEIDSNSLKEIYNKLLKYGSKEYIDMAIRIDQELSKREKK